MPFTFTYSHWPPAHRQWREDPTQNDSTRPLLHNSPSRRHRWSHRLHPRSARTTTTFCSPSPKEFGSLVNDHGAENEYVEVDMPSQPENTSDLTANCVFHIMLLVFFPYHPSKVWPCLRCLFAHPFSFAKLIKLSHSCSLQTFSATTSVFFSPLPPFWLWAFQKHCVNSSSCGLLLSWISSASSQIGTQASKQCCNSVFVPMSTLVWHFSSFVCVTSSPSIFFLSWSLFCHESFLPLMCSPASWKTLVTSFHLDSCGCLWSTVLGNLTVAACRLIHSSWFPTFAFCPSSGPGRGLLCHGFLEECNILSYVFFWSDVEVDCDHRSTLHPEPR